jgi:hypothetical protein
LNVLHYFPGELYKWAIGPSWISLKNFINIPHISISRDKTTFILFFTSRFNLCLNYRNRFLSPHFYTMSRHTWSTMRNTLCIWHSERIQHRVAYGVYIFLINITPIGFSV